MKYKILIITSLIFLFFPHQTFALSISPLKIEAVLDPGANRSVFLQVENNEKEAVEIIFKVKGARQDEQGRPIFGQKVDEAEAWLQIPESIILKPGDKKNAEFKLIVPYNVYPTTHILALVASRESADQGIGLGADLVSLLSVQISGTAVEKAQITNWSADNFFHFNKDWQFSLALKNFSNVRVPLFGEISLYNSFGQQVYRESLTMGPDLFPSASRVYQPAMNLEKLNLSSGIYQAQVAVIYGYTRQLLLQKISIVYVSRTLLLSILALLVLLVSFGGWRIRKKNKN